MTTQAVVHVIDDDESMRHALSSLFRSAELRVLTYPRAQDFLTANHPEAPSCLVLDVRLPGMNGLDFQDKLLHLALHLPVILMTAHGDVPMSVRAMKAGALDFLIKPFRDQDMLDAVARALALDGQRRMQRSVLDVFHSRFATLTPREQQVALLVAEGKMNKQVAAALAISEVTVKIHRGVAMRKLGAGTLADLVKTIEKLKDSGLLPSLEAG
jgi:FixJ family two-component response regulator